jgi:TonB family protein
MVRSGSNELRDAAGLDARKRGSWMLKELIFALPLSAISSAVYAEATAPETLRRTGSWVVDYDRDSCRLIAPFGTDRNMIIMRLTSYQPSDTFDFDLYGHRFARNSFVTKVKVDFGLRGAPTEKEAMRAKAGDLPIIFLGSMRLDGWESATLNEVGPPVSAKQEAAVSGVTVTVGGRKPFRLAFGSLAKPMEQFRACQADLVKTWGYDPAVQTTLSRPARPTEPPEAWLRPEDYPTGAVAMGQSGIVQFRLDIEADGRVVGCHVLARTNPDVFADATCRAVTKRAKLEPALDAGGKPVRSFWIRRVIWRIF